MLVYKITNNIWWSLQTAKEFDLGLYFPIDQQMSLCECPPPLV